MVAGSIGGRVEVDRFLETFEHVSASLINPQTRSGDCRLIVPEGSTPRGLASAQTHGDVDGDPRELLF
jgi:hypothetical protein